MRICIDLDGVICQLRAEHETYENLKPVEGAVDKLKALKKNGHYIIIFTARRMKTHNANVGSVIRDIGKVTLDWLDKHDVPYDEIHFGKPWADIYIDDNAFRFSNWDELGGNGEGLPVNKEKMFRGDA